MAKQPSYSRVSELLRYDPKTGVIRWRIATRGKRAGRIAGRIGGKKTSPHVNIEIDGFVTYAHHIARLLMSGQWPKDLTTFRDGNGMNCRWRNLVPTTPERIHKQKRLYRNNTSGYPGVGFHRRRRKWIARIKVDQRQIFLGYHDARSAAITARRRAAKRYGYRA